MTPRSAPTFRLLSFLSGVLLLGFSVPSHTKAQEAGRSVGTIEITTPDGTRVFDVVEGPPSDGFATGFNAQPRGETMVLGASLQGREDGAGATIVIRIGIYQNSMEQYCDPFALNIELSPAGERSGRLRLRPGGASPATCPNSPVDVEVTSASFDEDAAALTVEGRFSGPLGQGDDTIQVSEGSFQATVHAYENLQR